MPDLFPTSPSRLDELRERQQTAWRRGERLLVESLIESQDSRTSPLVDSDLLELIYAEAVLRSERHDAWAVHEYEQRFPQLGAELRRIFAVHSGLESMDAAEAETIVPPGDRASLENSTPRSLVGARFGRFKPLGVLGSGSFGTVYRAEDTQLRRQVALKVLHADSLTEAGAQQQFLEEARALAAVHHDHVVAVYEIGEEAGQFYLAMPLLAGESLASRLQREGALPADEVRRIGAEIASGLAAIHAKGLVHRDLKPGNLWLEAGNGRIKVLDLGLAFDPTTQNGGIAGTPRYMSPEQASGLDLDFRSDLFSLGTVLYECASGRRAFAGDSLTASLQAVREDTPLPLLRLNPGVPAKLATLIEQLHAKSPVGRPSSARDVADLLNAQQDSSRPRAEVATGPLPHAGRRLQRIWAVAAFAVIAVLVAVIAAVRHWPGATGSHPAAESSPRNTLSLPGTTAPPAVEIERFDVIVHELVGDQTYRPRGKLGHANGPFNGRLADAITVDVKLSRPAYCWLLAFQGDGRVVGLFPQDETDVPDLIDNAAYPSKRPESKFGLEDGDGLWTVALVASDTPLPAFAAWKKTHASVPWRRYESTLSDFVLRHDGLKVDSFTRNNPDGMRAEKTDRNALPLTSLVDWLRRGTGAKVEGVSFSVVAD